MPQRPLTAIKRIAWRAIRALKLERAVIMLRVCWLVREPLGLLIGETVGVGVGAPRRFTLRRSRQPVYLRPRSSDLRVFHEVFCYRAYELPDRARRLLGETPIAIDAGAHIGFFTLFLCESVPDVEVVALEPDPENARIARQNLGPLIEAGQVTLVEAAVGAFDGEVSFLAGEGMTSRRVGQHVEGATTVRQVDLLERLDGVGLLKLDTEGAEWDILRDPRWSERMPPGLMMEWHTVHDDQHESDPIGELTRLLSAADRVEHTVFDPGLVGHLWAFR